MFGSSKTTRAHCWEHPTKHCASLPVISLYPWSEYGICSYQCSLHLLYLHLQPTVIDLDSRCYWRSTHTCFPTNMDEKTVGNRRAAWRASWRHQRGARGRDKGNDENLRVQLARPMVGSGVAERSMTGSCVSWRQDRWLAVAWYRSIHSRCFSCWIWYSPYVLGNLDDWIRSSMFLFHRLRKNVWRRINW